jgi:hypothetical protein
VVVNIRVLPARACLGFVYCGFRAMVDPQLHRVWRTPRFDGLLAGLGSLGYLLARPREALTLFALLAACSIAVAITWDDATGRYLLPVYPILGMLSALGLWAAIITTEVATERMKIK